MRERGLFDVYMHFLFFYNQIEVPLKKVTRFVFFIGLMTIAMIRPEWE